MTILVTGGAGFIGSNFIFYMMKKYPDYRIICVDKLTYAGNLSTLGAVSNSYNFKFIKTDICNDTAIEEVFRQERPDIVVNFAAESHVDRSINNPKAFLTANTLGTETLLDACRKFAIKRFHQVSTDEVYGDLPLTFDDTVFTEQTPICANSPYSSSKAAADLLTMSYFRTYGVPVTISRCSNNYGPYQYPEKLIPLMIVRAVSNKTLPVYGNGLNVRNWLYVEDHCRAIDLIIHMGKVGEIYNIGGNTQMRNIDVVKLIIKLLNKSDNLITYVPDRNGHDLRYSISSNKIRNELGWTPTVDFASGLEYTVKWYLENSSWWEPLVGR